MNKMTDEQLSVLRHMLGIDVNDTRDPPEYRDYYCANPGNALLHGMADLGLVELYRTDGGYEWFCTTDTGKAAARASQRAMLLPKSKRIYRRWLSVSDALPDLTFRDFLTRREFVDIRKAT